MSRSPENSSRERSCRAVQRRGSAYLDDRLDAETRRCVARHLRGCVECADRFRAMRRLSQQVRGLPLGEPTRGLSDRVVTAFEAWRGRRVAQLGRRRRVVGWAAAAVAVAVSGAGWSIGYLMGIETERGRRTEFALGVDSLVAAASSEHEPGVGLPAATVFELCRQTGVDPGRFARAARGLLGDVAVIESIAARARRPLLAVQLSYFDLQAQAEQLEQVFEAVPCEAVQVQQLHGIARLIGDLAGALATADTADLAAWRQGALIHQVVTEARVLQRVRGLGLRRLAPGVDRARLQRALAEHAVGLDDHSRAELITLIELKNAVVSECLDEPIRRAYTEREGELRVFRGPAQLLFAAAFVDAGLEGAAEPFLKSASAGLVAVEQAERRPLQSLLDAMFVAD